MQKRKMLMRITSRNVEMPNNTSLPIRSSKGALIVAFETSRKIRILIDTCYVHSRDGFYWGKSREILTLVDVDSIEEHSSLPEFRKMFGFFLMRPFFQLRNGGDDKSENYSKFLHRKRYALPFSFYFDPEIDTPRIDERFRPDKGLMVSAALTPRNQLLFLFSLVEQKGIEDNRELWRELFVVHQLERPENTGYLCLNDFNANAAALADGAIYCLLSHPEIIGVKP